MSPALPHTGGKFVCDVKPDTCILTPHILYPKVYHYSRYPSPNLPRNLTCHSLGPPIDNNTGAQPPVPPSPLPQTNTSLELSNGTTTGGAQVDKERRKKGRARNAQDDAGPGRGRGRCARAVAGVAAHVRRLYREERRPGFADRERVAESDVHNSRYVSPASPLPPPSCPEFKEPS